VIDEAVAALTPRDRGRAGGQFAS